MVRFSSQAGRGANHEGVPVLETERLILRGPRPDDFPAHFAMWSDPRTVLHFGGFTFSEEDTWMRFLRNFGQWQVFGYGNWVVEEKAGGRYAGSLGFFQGKRPLDPAWRDQPEAGWAIAPQFHGQGFAREALAAATGWADANIEAPQSWCMINPDNAISRKVGERAGYRLFTDAAYRDKPVVILTRPRGGQP